MAEKDLVLLSFKLFCLEKAMAIDMYLLFLVTTLVVVFSPGPAAMVVAGQGASSGARYALFGTLGIASANVFYFLLSATGIASLLIASHLVFSTIKWLGVAYLLYLGCSAIFSQSGGLLIHRDSKTFSARRYFAKGFIIEISNPKALLYFSALLPQFLNTSEPLGLQLLLMGLSTLVLDLISYTLYGLLGKSLAQTSMKRWLVNLMNRSAGGFLLFAGLRMATVKQ